MSLLQERLRVGRELRALEARVHDDPTDWHAVDALLDALVAADQWERVREVALAEMLRLDGHAAWDARRARRLIATHNAAWDRLPVAARA